MTTGKTKSGFEFSVNEKMADDWRLISAIADAESSDGSKRISGLISVVRLLIGEEGEKKLCEHVMSLNDGMCPQSVMTNEIIEIINYLKKSKN